jgi:gas vesicle protein
MMRGILRFLAGLAIGMALSSTVMALIVPHRGSDAQRRLRDRLRQALDEARQAADQTRAEAYTRLDELKVRQPEPPDVNTGRATHGGFRR